jgi:hypothetical protein
MKIAVEDFSSVARCIVDPAPEWLLVALAHFAVWLGPDLGKGIDLNDDIVEPLQRAAKDMERLLPAFGAMPFEVKCPPSVKAILAALPELKNELAILGRKRKGRKLEGGREICAAVVVEAWRRIHGKPGRRSDRLYGACKEYWRICGGDEIGTTDDIENWRRPVQRAIDEDHGWIRNRLIGISSTKWTDKPPAKAVHNSP